MSYAEPCDLCGEDTKGRLVYDDNPIILCLKCDEGDLKTTERFQRKGYRQALADVRLEIEAISRSSSDHVLRKSGAQVIRDLLARLAELEKKAVP